MKHSNLFKTLMIALAISVSVVGCKKNPKNVTYLPNAPRQPITNAPVDIGSNPGGTRPASNPTGAVPGGRLPGDGTTGQPFDPNSGLNGRPLTTGSTTGGITGNNPNGEGLGNRPPEGAIRDADIFRANTVFFDVDRSSVKAAERAKIEAVATYLKSEPTSMVEVEGHCDERGTEEYNRALGERRALAIRQVLIDSGISFDRVSTVSFGEDKPADPGHDEAAWSKNRRGEFILLRANSAGK